MTTPERRVVLRTLLIVAVVIASVGGFKLWQQHTARAAQMHRGRYEVSVSVAPAVKVSWRREIHTVASLVATSGVNLAPQLSGQVTGIDTRTAAATTSTAERYLRMAPSDRS